MQPANATRQVQGHTARLWHFPSLINLTVARAQILHLLGRAGLQRLLAQQGITGATLRDGDDEDDDDDDDGAYGLFGMGRRRRRRPKGNRPQPPPVPSPEGQRLMESGKFGQSGYYQDKLRNRKQRISRQLMNRELGLDREAVRRGNQSMSQVLGR